MRRIPCSTALIVIAATALAYIGPSAAGHPLPQSGEEQRQGTPTTAGPPNGTLIAAGGGRLGPEIITRFIELAGGQDAHIIVIPTAGTRDVYPEDWGGMEAFERLGAQNVSILHTRNRRIADSEDFAGRLKEATGIWFTGGRQWRLVDSYLETRVHAELNALLERGGVIGGSSAGATIQASYLVRGAREGNSVMMAPGYEEGLGFLRNAAIDQHLFARNRQYDLVQVIQVHPDLLGIGIDEGTAVVVEGDHLEVVGAGKVAIYDARLIQQDGEPYVLLQPGDVFDLRTRSVVR